MPTEADLPRFAAIDIGSNTVKMTIAERNSTGRFQPVFALTRTTRLGEGTHLKRLTEASIRRTMDALTEFAEQCREQSVSGIAAVGTSALRDAVNRDDFIRRASETGIPVEAISGDEEAELSFTAIRCDPVWREVPALAVVDIGGGSTELVMGRSHVEFGGSAQVGAVRLTEAELRGNPPTVVELGRAHTIVNEVLQGLTIGTENYTLVGCGGTISTLAAINAGMETPNKEELHGTSLSCAAVERLVAMLSSLRVEDRRNVVGLPLERADIIVAGAIILQQVLYRMNATSIGVSTRGLRYGLLYNRFGTL